MDETIATALEAACPGRSVDRTFAVGPSWNGANETVGVAFADGSRAFCKVAAGDGSRIARESAVLRYLDAKRSVSGPAVVAADPDASTPYLVTAPAPGRELLGVWDGVGEVGEGPDAVREVEEGPEAMRDAGEDPDAVREAGEDPNAAGEARTARGEAEQHRAALLRRVGATLATLHAERFETHAEIVGGVRDGGVGDEGDPTLDLVPAPWPAVLRATIERTREIGTAERLADHYDAVLDCVAANRDRLKDAPAALLHGDVAKPNLFVVDGAPGDGSRCGPDGIVPIDWELSHVGDPARDLVRAEDQLLNGFDSTGPERYADALYEGYRDRAGGLPPGFADRRPVYDVVRILGRSGFLDQWASHLDEPVESLAARADAALRARLEAV